MLFCLKTAQKVIVKLDGQKYILNSSMYELKLARLLRLSVFEPYGERSRYFVRTEEA